MSSSHSVPTHDPLLKHALLTPEQMARADAKAIVSGVSGYQLMENAGRAVADAICARWPLGRVSVVCGPGNNGGDGFVVARLLHERGWKVRLALVSDPALLQGDAASHAQHWSGPVESLQANLLDTDLVVDALFGAGLSRPLEGAVKEWVQTLANTQVPVCAIDMPSGLDGATGQVQGAAAPAELTVTFFRAKPGHWLMPGRRWCGHLVVADIGIPSDVLHGNAYTALHNHPDLRHDALPRPSWHSHKYERGHVLVRGGTTMTGAARLAALASARMGAGLVTIAAPSQAWPVYAAALLGTIVLPCDTSDQWQALLADKRRNTMVLGPGAGNQVGPEVLQALATQQATVLDADALTAFADQRERLFQAIKGPCVLTPHQGEFCRLFDVGGSKLDQAVRAAQLSNAIVVYKGPDTIIAHPDGRAIINTMASPALATAGTGDVLAGMISGLLAQGMSPFLASAAAVWMHGRVAVEHGAGLVAEDIPPLLPGILGQFLNNKDPDYHVR